MDRTFESRVVHDLQRYNKETYFNTNDYDIEAAWNCSSWCEKKYEPIIGVRKMGKEKIKKVDLIDEGLYNELEEVIRSLITKEDQLMDNRMSWFFAFQGLLLTALSFAKDNVFLRIAAVPGIFTSGSTLLSIIQARRAIRNLEAHVETARKEMKIPYMRRLPVVGLYTRDKSPVNAVFMPSFFMPVVMTATWILLLVYSKIGEGFFNSQESIISVQVYW